MQKSECLWSCWQSIENLLRMTLGLEHVPCRIVGAGRGRLRGDAGRPLPRQVPGAVQPRERRHRARPDAAVDRAAVLRRAAVEAEQQRAVTDPPLPVSRAVEGPVVSLSEFDFSLDAADGQCRDRAPPISTALA